MCQPISQVSRSRRTHQDAMSHTEIFTGTAVPHKSCSASWAGLHRSCGASHLWPVGSGSCGANIADSTGEGATAAERKATEPSSWPTQCPHPLKWTATILGTKQRVQTGCARCKVLSHLATLAVSLYAFHVFPVARNACRLAARVARYLFVYLATRAASLCAFHVTPCRFHRRAGYLSGTLTAQRRGRDAGGHGAKSAALGSACACTEACPTSCRRGQTGDTPAPP